MLPRDPSVRVVAPRSAEFVVQIGPRDEAAVRDFCEQALSAMTGPISPARDYASRRLMFVKDPAALPYLRKGLDAAFGHRLWEGFLRIGPPAREMLEELSRSPDPKLSTGARVTLARLNRGG